MQLHFTHHAIRRLRRAANATILALALLLPFQSGAVHAQNVYPLYNGNFEYGFVSRPGCASGFDEHERQVGDGWNCFTNRGAARYGFYADSWSPVVFDGSYSQLIEINTWGIENADNERFAGIYHTVPTEPGAKYRLFLKGMIRTTNLDGDKWRYIVQVGYLQGDRTNWREVTNWTDVGWYTYYNRTKPGQFSDYYGIIGPTDEQITLFIRVWKKWGITNEELDVNLDAVTMEMISAPQDK